MPNTITDLKDVRVSQNALMPWLNTLLPLAAFSTNFSPEAADKLDTVKVPVIGARPPPLTLRVTTPPILTARPAPLP